MIYLKGTVYEIRIKGKETVFIEVNHNNQGFEDHTDKYAVAFVLYKTGGGPAATNEATKITRITVEGFREDMPKSTYRQYCTELLNDMKRYGYSFNTLERYLFEMVRIIPLQIYCLRDSHPSLKGPAWLMACKYDELCKYVYEWKETRPNDLIVRQIREEGHAALIETYILRCRYSDILKVQEKLNREKEIEINRQLKAMQNSNRHVNSFAESRKEERSLALKREKEQRKQEKIEKRETKMQNRIDKYMSEVEKKY